ncbi:OmpA family protein [Fibrobacter sp. UWH1]|uniref:OmpA family protein n=1 Tax=Fibrobacter sp. UWH1 TaxID=1964354 RepID=UPI000CC5FFDF|nr:OmpA family protein [Fibrobacter sp. UWH1]MDO4947200.1 OmpA family protein [Fibrobacter sp.]
MNKKILALGILAASMSFAAEADVASQPAPTASEVCEAALQDTKASAPANAISAKLTLAHAYGTLNELKAVEIDDLNSEQIPPLAAKCQKYAEIAKMQAETQTLRNHIAENWQKRAATNRSIEAIQEQIANARSGKMSSLAADLEAEKARLAQSNEDAKRQQERLQAEMQQNQEKFQAEAAAQEAALKAASEREAELQKQQAELQKKLAEEQAALEAEKKALAEERAKAEARQQDAMNKLNELQSKLIQVSKDARGIILSMSDILFDVNKATLKSDLKTSLAKVAGILSVYQQFNVSIEGNTDNTGSEEHNMKLSQQRADNVMNFLVEQGIEAGRLTAKGLGMSMPIADNSTKEGRQKNRRVDLVIQDKALQAQ